MFAYLKSAVSAVANGVQQQVTNSLQLQQVQIGDRWFNIKEQLGEGGFAYVYSVEDSSTGQMYALKRMLCQDAESRSIAEKEIRMMKLLKGHPNIAQYIASTSRENRQSSTTAMEYFILMELCTGGSLIDLIKRRQSSNSKLAELEICQLFQQVCRAIAHMHSQQPPIAHRDIKIENVLISARGELKLCDFGSCCTRSKAYSSQKEIVEEEEIISKYSTQMYRAPEMASLASSLKPIVISEKVDIWALGCLLYTLAFFTQPFQEGGNLQILSGSYDVPENHSFSKYVTALIKRLLTVDPTVRPDIRQVLNLCDQWHAWLKGGGKSVVKPSAVGVSTLSPSRPPQPTSALTDPSQRSRRAHDSTAPPLESQSAKSPKSAKKSKRPPKHTQSAPPIEDGDDWADFSAAPPSSIATSKKATRAKSKQAPSNDDSSSSDSSSSDSSDDDDGHQSTKHVSSKSTRPSSSSTKSSSTHAPPAAPSQPSTVSLFDLSSFGVTSPTSSSSSSNSFATHPSVPSTSHRKKDSQDWASFDTPTTSTFPSANNSTTAANSSLDDWASFDGPSVSSDVISTSSRLASHRPPPPIVQSTSSISSAEFDFDFSGLHAPPVHTPLKDLNSPNSASSNSSSSSSTRKQRRQDGQRNGVEVIVISKLSTVGGKPFDNEKYERIKLKIAKNPTR